MTSTPKTLLDVLRAGETYLREREVDAPRLSMELLLAHVLRMPRLQLYLSFDQPMNEAELAGLRDLLRRRGQHEPMAYVLGEVAFHEVRLVSDARALVPRPETEGVVERARRQAPQGARVVDLGTGSGAIAVALAHVRPDLTVCAVDASTDALALARVNVARYQLESRVELVLGDWFAPLHGRHFDFLVSNPPYVDPAQPELLAADVRRYEPHAALFTAPGDPASAYRRILAGVAEHLVAGAQLVLETGVGAAEPALAAMQEAAVLSDVKLEADLAGLPRYLTATVR